MSSVKAQLWKEGIKAQGHTKEQTAKDRVTEVLAKVATKD
jgi:hypothetical protein